MNAAGAGCLAQRGTDPARKLGKAVSNGQSAVSLLQPAPSDQIIDLRNQIVQRAARRHAGNHRAVLTEGHAAVHAPLRLFPPLLRRES